MMFLGFNFINQSTILILCIISNSIQSEAPSIDSRRFVPSNDFSDVSPIYYDMDGKPVPQLSNQVEVLPTLKRGAVRYGWLPCSCQNLVCGCCSGININSLNFKRNGCMNFTYDPKEFALNFDMLMDESPIYHNSISGKNPPPACIPVSPIPFVPGIEFCLRFYDVYTPGQNFHACVNFETQIVKQPLFVLQFDCFRIGADGFDIIKPHVENAGLPTTPTMLPIEDADPIPSSSTEFYDEVLEEKKSSHNQSKIVKNLHVIN